MSEYIVGTDNHEEHWLTGEQIVRCRDCKYIETVDLSSHFGGDHKHDQRQCTRLRSLDCFTMPVDLDDFCSFGERKNNA